ncbi:DUF87 domain-containing protein [Vibrio mimicus]
MKNITNILGHSDKLVQLLGDKPDENFVGYVYSMNFSEALILTNDAFKEKVSGIPHNSFLVATSINPKSISTNSDWDKEVILLRVLGPSSLPFEGDFIKTRIEHHQRRTKDEMYATDVLDGLDVLTHSELQAGGLTCRVLGTFFIDNGHLRLGSDVENYMSSSRLRVFKPRGDALEKIVNHVNDEVQKKALEEALKSGFHSMPSPIEIGTVRYTSTARLHRGDQEILVPVNIQPTDFLARRTAILGMTRTGKSNTLKTTVSAVAMSAAKDATPVGQIIFDINGEYANANQQDDGSSIADVFSDAVIRYRGIETKGDFRDLRNNFYERPDIGLNIIQDILKDENISANDMKILLSSFSLDELPADADRSEINRYERHVAAFKALLSVRGFEVPKGHKVKFSVSAQVKRQILENVYSNVVSELEVELGKIPTLEDIKNKASSFFPDYEQGVEISDAVKFFKDAREADKEIRKNYEDAKKLNKKDGTKIPSGLYAALRSSAQADDWLDDNLKAITNLIVGKNDTDMPIRVKSYLGPIAQYHSPIRKGEVENEIYDFLIQGKIVILDLSVGTETVRKAMSLRIASTILSRSMSKFHSGEQNTNIVIYVEEAHNLIGKKDDLTGVWPRIAKEGAKAKIAFVYATQEPSSIHPNILANTENWFVTHLNNEDELRALGKFYDFSDFHMSLKTAQDVGFARIKTLSSPFVVPTQIHRFTPNDLKPKYLNLKGGKNAL